MTVFDLSKADIRKNVLQDRIKDMPITVILFLYHLRYCRKHRYPKIPISLKAHARCAWELLEHPVIGKSIFQNIADKVRYVDHSIPVVGTVLDVLPHILLISCICGFENDRRLRIPTIGFHCPVVGQAR